MIKRKFKTWNGASEFEYNGTVETGTLIVFGSSRSEKKVSVDSYKQLLTEFSGKTVDCGTSRTAPPRGSLGKWLQEKVTKTALASYVGPVLVDEGYARKLESKIGFLKTPLKKLSR